MQIVFPNGGQRLFWQEGSVAKGHSLQKDSILGMEANNIWLERVVAERKNSQKDIKRFKATIKKQMICVCSRTTAESI